MNMFREEIVSPTNNHVTNLPPLLNNSSFSYLTVKQTFFKRYGIMVDEKMEDCFNAKGQR